MEILGKLAPFPHGGWLGMDMDSRGLPFLWLGIRWKKFLHTIQLSFILQRTVASEPCRRCSCEIRGRSASRPRWVDGNELRGEGGLQGQPLLVRERLGHEVCSLREAERENRKRGWWPLEASLTELTSSSAKAARSSSL